MNHELENAYEAMKRAEKVWVASWATKDMFKSNEYREFERLQIRYEGLCDDHNVLPRK